MYRFGAEKNWGIDRKHEAQVMVRRGARIKARSAHVERSVNSFIARIGARENCHSFLSIR